MTFFIAGQGWYENTTSTASEPSFKFRYSYTIHCHDNVAADVNGDGKDDIIANSNDEANPYLVWYDIPDDPSEQWPHVIIGSGIHGRTDPKGAADLDNDGDVDIVRGNSWFENNTGNGFTWTEHPVLKPDGGSRAGKYGLALKTWVTDIDKDGDPDIIQAECDTADTRVYWWENRRDGNKWKFHLISENSTNQDFHSLAVSDFDNDGDEDVFSGGGPMTTGAHQWIIWENTHGDASEWKKQIVLEGYRCHEA